MYVSARMRIKLLRRASPQGKMHKCNQIHFSGKRALFPPSLFWRTNTEQAIQSPMCGCKCIFLPIMSGKSLLFNKGEACFRTCVYMHHKRESPENSHTIRSLCMWKTLANHVFIFNSGTHWHAGRLLSFFQGMSQVWCLTWISCSVHCISSAHCMQNQISNLPLAVRNLADK